MEIMIVREDSTSYATTSLLTFVGMEDTCIGISRKSDSNTSVVHVDPTQYRASNETLIPVGTDEFLVSNTEVWVATAKTQSRQDYLIFCIYDETSNKTKGIFLCKESDPVIETSSIYERCLSMFGYIPTFVKVKSADQNWGNVQFQPNRSFVDSVNYSIISANTVYFHIGRLLRTLPDSSMTYAWVLLKESTGDSPLTIGNLPMVAVSWIDSSKYDAISADIRTIDGRLETVENQVSRLASDAASFYVAR